MRILSSTPISQVCDRHGPKTKREKKKRRMVLSLRIFDTCKGSRISLLWKYPFGNFQNRQGKKDEKGCLGVDFHSPDKRWYPVFILLFLLYSFVCHFFKGKRWQKEALMGKVKGFNGPLPTDEGQS